MGHTGACQHRAAGGLFSIGPCTRQLMAAQLCRCAALHSLQRCGSAALQALLTFSWSSAGCPGGQCSGQRRRRACSRCCHWGCVRGVGGREGEGGQATAAGRCRSTRCQQALLTNFGSYGEGNASPSCTRTPEPTSLPLPFHLGPASPRLPPISLLIIVAAIGIAVVVGAASGPALAQIAVPVALQPGGGAGAAPAAETQRAQKAGRAGTAWCASLLAGRPASAAMQLAWLQQSAARDGLTCSSSSSTVVAAAAAGGAAAGGAVHGETQRAGRLRSSVALFTNSPGC